MAAPIHIAGRGAAAPLGIDVAEFVERIFAGESAIRPLRRLAGVECLTEVAAELSPDDGLNRSEDMACHAAERAAREALDGVDQGAADLHLVVATTKADLSGITTVEGNGLGSPARLAHRLHGALKLEDSVTAVSCACASGLSAMALAGRMLRAGRASRALVVGTDALTPFILKGFSGLLALSPGPCRPFDRSRRGLSLGEGAAAILLSTRSEDASGLQLAGWGESNDANHVTGPSRDGAGLALAMRRSLRSAGLLPTDVDFLHLHGTGTRFNDAMEGEAAHAVFGDAPPPSSGSKGQIGHTLGAAGVLESLVAIAALERGLAPPNVGLEQPDESCRLRLSRPAEPLSRAVTALKVAAGFGGINAALVFRKEVP